MEDRVCGKIGRVRKEHLLSNMIDVIFEGAGGRPGVSPIFGGRRAPNPEFVLQLVEGFEPSLPNPVIFKEAKVFISCVNAQVRFGGSYPSGQRGQTVNLLTPVFSGSNPLLPTISSLITRMVVL